MSLAKEDGEILKVKVPYEQIKPHVASELHKPVSSSPVVDQGTTPAADPLPIQPEKMPSQPTPAAQTKPEPEDLPMNPPPSAKQNAESSSQPEKMPSEPTPATQTKPDPSDLPTNPPPSAKQNAESPSQPQPTPTTQPEVIITSQKRAKKRPIGPLPVRPATSPDLDKLLPLIDNGEWLTDEHIDGAQAMLAKHFPYIGGLQAVWVFISEGCQSVGMPKEEFVQILNIAGNHWIMVSNVGCPKDTITVYDSLYSDVHPSSRAKFLRQMAYMLMPTSKHVTLQWADMQKQVGGNDCGLFAIAVATCLCYGILPEDCVWKQEEMRDHLSKCLKGGELTLFPQLPKVRQHQSHARVERFEVFCHCRQPYTGNVFMAQCDICQDWFHRGCQRIQEKWTKTLLSFVRNANEYLEINIIMTGE